MLMAKICRPRCWHHMGTNWCSRVVRTFQLSLQRQPAAAHCPTGGGTAPCYNLPVPASPPTKSSSLDHNFKAQGPFDNYAKLDLALALPAPSSAGMKNKVIVGPVLVLPAPKPPTQAKNSEPIEPIPPSLVQTKETIILFSSKRTTMKGTDEFETDQLQQHTANFGHQQHCRSELLGSPLHSKSSAM